EQRLVEVAVGAFEGAHEGALLRPALPALVLLLLGELVGLVVADARPRLLVHPRHSGASLGLVLAHCSAAGHSCRRAVRWRCHYGITLRGATRRAGAGPPRSFPPSCPRGRASNIGHYPPTSSAA